MNETTDPLRDILRHIHISSAVVLRGEFRAPWGFTSCTAEELAGVLGLRPAQIVLFHVVRGGTCQVALDIGDAVSAQAGEALVLPYAGLHRMGRAPSRRRVGYQYEAAFSRAFKRRLDKPPSDWRSGAS